MSNQTESYIALKPIREVAFTDVHIAQDGSVEFTAVLTDESINDSTELRRNKFEF